MSCEEGLHFGASHLFHLRVILVFLLMLSGQCAQYTICNNSNTTIFKIVLTSENFGMLFVNLPHEEA